MGDLESELEAVKKIEARVLVDIDDRNRERSIDCSSCSDSHIIGELEAIQTYWHTPPRGCTEGDYWNLGEMQFVCPETEVVNRLLFNNNDVPYEERRKHKNDPEAQFREKYGRLFRDVVDLKGPIQSGFVNNSYVDQNREAFGLVEKRSS